MVLITAAAVLALVRSRESDLSPVAYARTEDALALVVLIEAGVGDEILGANIRETSDVVEVSVRVRRPAAGIRSAIAVTLPYPIRLGTPLGARRVTDQFGQIAPERQLDLRAPASH